MIADIDKRILEIRNEILKKKAFQEEAKSIKLKLQKKQEEIDAVLPELRMKERKVKRLNGVSLSSIVATVANNKPERLREEETRLYKTQVVYKRLLKELSDIRRKYDELSKKYQLFIASEEELKSLYAEKKNLMLHAGDETSIQMQSKVLLLEDIHKVTSIIDQTGQIGESLYSSINDSIRVTEHSSPESGYGFFKEGGLMSRLLEPASNYNPKSLETSKSYLKLFQESLQEVNTAYKFFYPKIESFPYKFEIINENEFFSLVANQKITTASLSNLQAIRRITDTQMDRLNMAKAEFKKLTDEINRSIELLMEESYQTGSC